VVEARVNMGRGEVDRIDVMTSESKAACLYNHKRKKHFLHNASPC
jgi:hypothetical protein